MGVFQFVLAISSTHTYRSGVAGSLGAVAVTRRRLARTAAAAKEEGRGTAVSAAAADRAAAGRRNIGVDARVRASVRSCAWLIFVNCGGLKICICNATLTRIVSPRHNGVGTSR